MTDWKDRSKCLIIAEAGVNHNGNVDIAKKLCLAAKESGADVIKFQTWITDKIITKTVKQADYQIENTRNNQSQYDMLKSLELSFDQFRRIKSYCDEIGILFASTADEPESLDFLVEIGIPFIKIGSDGMGNIPFLRYVGSKGLPVIMSTGMSYLADVEISLHALREGGAENIVLLHCTTNYPCPYESVNLKAMDTLKAAFGYEVGYSDHTCGMEVPIAAVARGAKVIEKHFTLDRCMDGPDHVASTEPEEFKKMVLAIRNIESAFGDGFKKPTKSEREISKVVLKKIVAKREIPKGKKLEEEDLCIKRSDSGVSASAWDLVIGTTAHKHYMPDEGIEI